MSLKESKTFYDGFVQITRGMDSGRAASLIGPDQLAFLVNGHTRKDYPQSRPGWSKVQLTGDTFQFGRWQGASPYISPGGAPFLVASIGGHLVRFDPIGGSVLDLSTTADLTNPNIRPRVWFKQAEQFLIVQDNFEIPLIFDGSTLRRAVPIDFGGEEFPVGNAMEYNNGRLWVALPDRQSFVGGDLAFSDTGYASDLLKFTQNKFLSSGGSFALPSPAGFITAMLSVANMDSVLGQGPLIVFGQYGAATVNAPFDSAAWESTSSPIVSVGLLSRGPSGPTAVINVNGDLWYRAEDGERSFMIARRDHGTWVNTPLSHEMERVLKKDDPYLLEWVSKVDFDNRMLSTVSPYRATYNGVEYGVAFRGLSVLDFLPTSSMFDRNNPNWDGIWNGLSILQILKVNCYGKDRCFMFVLNDCQQIELWELSTDNRFDNVTTPIQWSIDTRQFGFQDKSEFLKQFVRTETWIRDMVGPVGYIINYKPDDYPFWTQLDQGVFCAGSGMCSTPNCTPPSAPFPQYRARKISSGPDNSCEGCTNKELRNGFEFQFQLLIQGSCEIRRFRAVATEVPEDVAQGCLTDNEEETCCAERGCEFSPWSYRTFDPCSSGGPTISLEWDVNNNAPTWDVNNNSPIQAE